MKSVSRAVVSVSLFFFSSRRRHTRYIGDWSSDVCSSDLDRRRDGGNFVFRLKGHHAKVFVLRELVQNVGSWGNRVTRSEERRVGKECRSRWSRSARKKKRKMKADQVL